MAGVGPWAVGTFGNALRLDYFVDGILRATDERPGHADTWYFSGSGYNCGPHTFE